MTVVFVAFCYNSNSALNKAYRVRFLLHVSALLLLLFIVKFTVDSLTQKGVGQVSFQASVWIEFTLTSHSLFLSVNLLLRGLSLWQGQGLWYFPQSPCRFPIVFSLDPLLLLRYTHHRGGWTWMSFTSSSSSFFSHFLLPLFQMSSQPASSLCHTARLPPSLTFPPFPPSTSLLPCPPSYLSPPSFLTSSSPPCPQCAESINPHLGLAPGGGED